MAAEVKTELSLLRAMAKALNQIVERNRHHYPSTSRLEVHEIEEWPYHGPIFGIAEVKYWLHIIPWRRAILMVEIREENIICTVFDKNLVVDAEMRQMAIDIQAAAVKIVQDFA